MSIRLTDDGTMDTVLYCTECGKEFRGTYDGGGANDEAPVQEIIAYENYIMDFIAEVVTEHECEVSK